MEMDAAYEPYAVKLPFPSDFTDEERGGMLDRAKQMCMTAQAIWQKANASGQAQAIAASITQDQRLASTKAIDSKELIADVNSNPVALHLTALLNEYDMGVVQSAQQLRNFCTNILIEKAAIGKTEQVQLRAVEMLGKIKDVALFEERSTVLVEHMTTDDIRSSLRQKINRLRSDATNAVEVEAKQLS